MGGSIEVITSPGAGTEIVIRARLQLVGQEETPDEAAEPLGEEELVDFCGMRALLVEDKASTERSRW